MEILDLNNEEDTKTTDEMEPKKPEEKTSPYTTVLQSIKNYVLYRYKLSILTLP